MPPFGSLKPKTIGSGVELTVPGNRLRALRFGERGWVREILARLVDEYDVEPGRCERDLLGLLRELREQGLITVVDATAQ